MAFVHVIQQIVYLKLTQNNTASLTAPSCLYFLQRRLQPLWVAKSLSSMGGMMSRWMRTEIPNMARWSFESWWINLFVWTHRTIMENQWKSRIIYIYMTYLSMRLCLLFLTPFPIRSRGPPDVWDPSRIRGIWSDREEGLSGDCEWGTTVISGISGAFQWPDSIFPDCENWALLDKLHLSLLVYSPVIQHSYGKWMNMAYFKMITIDYL